MAFPDDPRGLKVWFGFGASAADDPTTVTFEQVSPNPDDPDDPGLVLESVSIQDGRVGDTGSTDPTRIDFALRNPDGRFSRRNVSGPYYGRLRAGTPVRVTVDIGDGDVDLATAFAPEFSPRSDGPGINRRVPVNALGILAKLGRDQNAVSATQRFIDRHTPSGYWPLNGSTASAIGGEDASVTSDLIVASCDVGAETSIAMDLVFTGSLGSGTEDVLFTQIRGGYLVFVHADWGSGTPTLNIADLDLFSPVLDTATDEQAMAAFDGQPHHWRFVVEQNGPDVDVSVYLDGVLIMSGTRTGKTAVADTVVWQISSDVTFDATELTAWAGSNTPLVTDAAAAAFSYAGEAAADRIVRLAVEEGLAVDVAAGDSTLMGPQPTATVLAVMRECETADHGVLVERPDGRVGYDPLETRFNAPVALTLAYGTETDPGDVSDLVPVDDDRDVANLVTVAGPSGFQYTVEEDSGPVGTDETDGIGVRPLPIQLNLHSDDLVPIHAGWLLRMGTIDKPRYVVVLNPYSEPSIRASVLALKVGSRIQIPDAPAEDHGPDGLDLIVEGRVIDIGADVWTVALWCEPYEPYRVQVLAEDDPDDDDETVGWAEFDTCVLASDVTSSATSWSMTCDPDDTSDPDDFPRRHYIEGEEIRVDSSTGGASPTWTVTRSVNGVVMAHLAGTSAPLGDPLILVPM